MLKILTRISPAIIAVSWYILSASPLAELTIVNVSRVQNTIIISEPALETGTRHLREHHRSIKRDSAQRHCPERRR